MRARLSEQRPRQDQGRAAVRRLRRLHLGRHLRDRAAHGLQQVCNTDPPNYVTYQCSSGSVSPTPFFERTNCVGDNDGPDADWESPMHCPNGMVAVGMRLSTRPGGKERRMIDGIALDCSPLQGTP